MIEIFHNNRCSKSRCALQYLEDSKLEFKIVHYLQDVPSVDELSNLIKKLGLKPIDLVRKNESIYKEQFKNGSYTDEKWLQILHEYPILIERPIVIQGNKAIISRPPELVKNLFD
jgi:arsenate reductase